MKIPKITGVIIILLAIIGVTACGSPGGGDNGEIQRQLAKVERGDLTVSVTGSGNIETSREARLSFSSGGKVANIYVEEGDAVKEGDVLARLDTRDLELALAQAEVAFTQAQLSLTQAQIGLQTAEYNLGNTVNTKAALELALKNAQTNTKVAQYNLEKTLDMYTWSDIKIAQADADEAERYVEDVLLQLSYYSPEDPGYEVWQNILIHAQSRLNTANDRLEAMTSGLDTATVAIKKLQLEAAQMAETQAQKNLDDLSEDVAIKELQVNSAGQSVELAEQSVEMSRKSLDQARKKLDEATITATFDGAVAALGAKEGDTVASSAQMIVYLIDPGSMDLMVEIDEIDIAGIKTGQEAIVSIDALYGVKFPGEVASIYPVPNVLGGVVLYNVKIGIDIPEDAGLKVGMSASANIIIDKQSNVLLVPSRAVTQNSEGNTIVKVQLGEQIQERPVTIGISDDLFTEVVSGLDEGETVIVEIKVRPTSGMGLF